MKICPNCNAQYDDDVNFCTQCGTNLGNVMLKYCPACHEEVRSVDAVFCVNCGLEFTDEYRPLDYMPVNVCRHCGFVVSDENASVCVNCMQEIDDGFNKPVDIANYGFDRTYYRVCTYCGAAYELNTDNCMKINCDVCGNQIRTELREDPYLTDEEIEEVERYKAEAERIEAERRKREEEEAERRRQQALEEAEALKKRKERIVKIMGACAVGCVVLVIGSFALCNGVNKGRVKKVNEALERGDYVAALDYCSRKMPIGKVKNEITALSAKISKAANYYKMAENSLANYEYYDAMKYADSAMKSCPELKGPQELFETAQGELTRYYKKSYDAENYAAVISANEVYTDWRTDELNEMINNVNNMVVQNINSGNEKLDNSEPREALDYAKAALAIDSANLGAKDLESRIARFCVNYGNIQLRSGNTTNALTYANLAEEADPDNSDVNGLKNNIDVYNEGMVFVNKARTFYANGNYDAALNALDEAFNGRPLVKQNNQSLYDSVENAKKAKEAAEKAAREAAEKKQREIDANPLIVSDVGGTVVGSHLYAVITVKNRSSKTVRSAKVTAEFRVNGVTKKSNYEYAYDIDPGEERYVAIDVYIGYSYVGESYTRGSVSNIRY